MLSYRHGFHAGNHADVLKHLVLSLILKALLKKDKPFCFIDTHGGAGRYSLVSESAQKNKEHESGIARLWQKNQLPPGLEPYLEAVRTTNPGTALRWYPGSPRIARHFLRPQDRMVLAELHPNESRELAREFEGDQQVRVEAVDGYALLKALLPPRERRGLVHIDPSYELKDERRRVLEAVSEAYRRWPTGIYAIWYPVQDVATRDAFLHRVEKLKIPRTLVVELMVRPEQAFRLNGSGMILINPPWQLDEALAALLPDLSLRLGEGGEGSFRVEWLTEELPAP